MKTNTLTLLLCLVSCVAFSQNNFGLLAGLNLSTTPEDDKYRLGFHAGAFKRFDFNKFWYGQTDLMYTQRGFKADKEDATNSHE